MPSVLIADNDRAVNGLLREVLSRLGLPVLQAFDGHAARDMARGPGVRVLVCDLDMPGASGVEVLESLRDLTRPPLAIVVSGYLDVHVRDRLAALPFVRDVLGKPFDLLRFADRVRDLLTADTKAATAVEGGAG
jgi:CheY-like chemotaxis protein